MKGNSSFPLHPLFKDYYGFSATLLKRASTSSAGNGPTLPETVEVVNLVSLGDEGKVFAELAVVNKGSSCFRKDERLLVPLEKLRDKYPSPV